MKSKLLQLALFFIFLTTINSKIINTNQLNGPNNTVYYGENNVANGQNNQFAGSNNYVEGYTNGVIGNSNVLNGSQNLIAGEKNQVSGYGNLISGQGNVVLGSGSSPQDIAAFQQQFLNMLSTRGLPAPPLLLNNNSPVSLVKQDQTVSAPSTSPTISSQSQPKSQPQLNNYNYLTVQSASVQANAPKSDNYVNHSQSVNQIQTNVADDSLAQIQIQNQQISLAPSQQSSQIRPDNFTKSEIQNQQISIASSQQSSQIRPDNQPDNSSQYQASKQIQPQKLQVASNQTSNQNQSQQIVSNQTTTSRKKLRNYLRPSPYYNTNVDNSEVSTNSSNSSNSSNNNQGSVVGQVYSSNSSLKTASQVASYLTSNQNSNTDGVYVIPSTDGNEASILTNIRYNGY